MDPTTGNAPIVAPTVPAPATAAPAIDLEALAKLVAQHIRPIEAKAEVKPDPPKTPEQSKTLEERLAATEAELVSAKRGAALDAWTRTVEAELTHADKGVATAPGAFAAQLRAELDGELRFTGPDGKPREVFEGGKFRPLTVTERVAELRAAHPAAFIAPKTSGGGGPSKGAPGAPPDTVDIEPMYLALKGTSVGHMIDPARYQAAVTAALDRVAVYQAQIKQMGGN